ncbi:helix-turn-helix domain-containing protein [Bacillus cytotoxicus]|uniref:helix-turn-helix domain-containing protein n=1 Tax=Bacillus cytotoxicus TaxID=580165 RepID=UPI000863D369|nr:helix-turn-helix transcriptional regulator [Bacillus cytotoxicus]MDH2858865.1 helix-turn-helix domain-containing protein [Bacillus cytotoxicus]MDH2871348.1 helix-turn-helix domain-containing protein [Bacillus cytotoxicus]MDH2874853.1 helix-turn-helix domain-containing protein [Bacillus cytotoxicus]MDH2919773.1 helix-turn-helix domain-containing protein [Bacillus cytotoxicus]QTR81421.1 helix-turn-helix transcriptional regulator [Bacillus cytotoxicus]
MDTLSYFAANIKLLREERGLTQQQVADKMTLSRSRVNSHENAISAPDLDTLVQYANFYDVSTDFLLGLTDERRTYSPTDKISYLYTSLSDVLTNLTIDQQDEIIKNLMRYARFLKKDVQDYT